MAQQFIAKHDHERTDAQVRPLVIFLILMTGGVLFSFALTTILFEFFTQRVESKTAPAHALKIVDEEPAGPLLQVVPGLDLRQMKAAEQERYSGYGWVDQRGKVVHIPVEKAIDLMLEKGLPARQEQGSSAE